MTLSLMKRLFSGILQHTPLGAATTERIRQNTNHIVVGTKKSSALQLLNFPAPGMPCLMFEKKDNLEQEIVDLFQDLCDSIEGNTSSERLRSIRLTSMFRAQ
jgi:hypothetical protein